MTVDLDALHAGKQLTYLEAAYRIARAMAVAAVRKTSADEVDLSQIENHVEALGTWSERIVEMAVKARTIQKSGKLIEECATDFKEELDRRVEAVLRTLRHGVES